MIVNECHSSRGPPSHEPRILAVIVPEPPELGVFDSLIQDSLGHEVKESHAPCFVQPVAQSLPWAILVKFKAIVSPPGIHRFLRSHSVVKGRKIQQTISRDWPLDCSAEE